MGRAQIHEKPGGGGNSASFVKLWEGDITEQTKDVTGGAVDPCEYQVLLIRYNGTLKNTTDNSRYFGLGTVSSASQSSYDVSVSKQSEDNVDFTMAFYCRSDGSYPWVGFREARYTGGSVVRTENPFSFFASPTTGVTINLHFTIYGLKL